MSVPGRRKQKIEFEPVPIIGIGNVEVDVDDAVIVRSKPTEGGLVIPVVVYPVVSVEEPVQVDDTVIHESLTSRYVAPPVIAGNTTPTIIINDEGVSVIPTAGGNVINVIDYSTEPIDETLDGLPKVFGRRIKEPITVK